MAVFSKFLHIECPTELDADSSGRNPAFQIHFAADGEIPFPQVVLHGNGWQKFVKEDAIQVTERGEDRWAFVASVPAGLLAGRWLTIQVEGCRTADLNAAEGSDWIKEYRNLELRAAVPKVEVIRVGQTGLKVYFGIHKHMHQPYYDAANTSAWDGEKDEIFGSRAGNYTGFVPAAIHQYAQGGLPHAGLSSSWSGSLIEQLHRCGAEGMCHGRFAGWNEELRRAAREHTALGNPRLSFSAFGFFHPLMPLIPHRDIVRQIDWHRRCIRDTFGVEASNVMFPPETAFHVRMIPALLEAGITAVMYDSIHRYRACRDYPYAGPNEGMLPPNRADQVNPPASDWLQLQNVWAGSAIAPSLLRPEYVGYRDADGQEFRIVAIPAERYIGNEDARGGFGALQYPDVLGQVYASLAESGQFDPAHPPFFLLHSDGDNHGGGAESYYNHNTAQLVEWLRGDERFELTTAEDYLQRFPPDPANTIHIEPGSWSGADNGDPQFAKWFGRAEETYSPDLNSWAVLTALQNLVHTLEDAEPGHPALADGLRLLLTAETSCYWYWTGQTVWDQQVTSAANRAYDLLRDAVEGLVRRDADRTAPTIFPPWVTPANPGGQCWGHGGLTAAPFIGTVRCFVHDVSGLRRVLLHLRSDSGERTLEMHDHGPYPSQTGARLTGHLYSVDLPPGLGDVRYFVAAEDQNGNLAKGALERIFLAG